MKKKRFMLILIGVLVLLIDIYYALSIYNKKSEEKENKNAESEQIYVTSIKNIEKISYSNGSSNMEFVKDSGKWYRADNKDFPLTQSYLETLEGDTEKLKASRKMENGDSLSDYGLDKPQYTISITDDSGNETKLLIGNLVGENYYLLKEGKDTVYTVGSSIVENMQFNYDDMLQMETFPLIGEDNIKKVDITRPGEETFTYKSSNENDKDAISTIAGGIGAVEFESCADYSLTNDKLSKYGLDEASRTKVEISYKTAGSKKKTTLIYYIGSMTEDNAYNYLQLDGSKMTYTVKSAVIKNMLNES